MTGSLTVNLRQSLAGMLFTVITVGSLEGQVVVGDPYLSIRAGANDPLFTTYAAPTRGMKRPGNRRE